MDDRSVRNNQLIYTSYDWDGDPGRGDPKRRPYAMDRGWTCQGVIMKEWKNVNRKTYILLVIALLVLVGSFILISYGSYIGELANRQGY